MTPEQLAKLLRDFLIRAEKRSALLLLSHFDRIKAELAAYLIDRGVHPGSIDDILNELERQIATRTIRFESIVTDRQDLVIRQVARTLNAYLKASIFDPDRDAIAKLAGRASDGGSLTRIFDRMKEPVRAAAKEALLNGMAEGLGARQIATKLNKAADLGYGRALTIARTETNEAVRAASREFYSDGGIKRYVWMAVLDARTCMICWRLHGKIFNSRKKVFSHPNCRCVLVPLIDGRQRVETGVERFKELEPGYQKQILGPTRYELFKSGAGFQDFVGSKNTREFGQKYSIRPLSAFG
jgi:SPP1 gp7 family putative phage head morphogenesis protein